MLKSKKGELKIAKKALDPNSEQEDEDYDSDESFDIEKFIPDSLSSSDVEDDLID